jgi:hypothetical protein
MIQKFYALVLISLLPLTSFASEVYVVKNIKISANDKNASVARNMAIETGQVKAFNILVKQNFPEASADIDNFSMDQILNTVAGFELGSERRSSTNYLATLNVKFNKQQIDQLMKKHGAKFKQAEMLKQTNIAPDQPLTLSEPTIVSLIIPIYQKEGKSLWLDEENPWHSYIAENVSKLSSANPKFILPIGDLEDLKLINKNLLNHNLIDLTELMDKYNVNNIVLARLVEVSATNEETQLQLNYINKFNGLWQEHEFDSIVNAKPAEAFNQAYQLLDHYNFSKNSSSANKNFSHLRSKHSLNLEFAMQNISDWIALEDLINSSNYFENLKINSMNIKNYKISFDYKISLIDLEEFFKMHGYELTQEEQGTFKLSKEFKNAEF